MPYGERRLVGVKLASIPNLIYGFRTDVAEATSNVLGHVNALNGGNYIRGIAFGINSPKPPTAKKRFASPTKNYESSFVDFNSVDSARGQGWTIKPAKIARYRSTAYSKLVSVDFRVADPVDAADGNAAQAGVSVKYAWRMPLYQYNKLTAGDKGILGIEDVPAGDVRECVFGMNSPKPYRSTKVIQLADGKQQVIKTFVASAKMDNLSQGWA